MGTSFDDYMKQSLQFTALMNRMKVAQHQKIEPDETDYSSLEETFFFHFYDHICSSIRRLGIDNPNIEDDYVFDMWRFMKVIQTIGFVEYVYLFNNVEKDTNGSFEIYADFENDWVSKDRLEFIPLDQNQLFDNSFIPDLFYGSYEDPLAFEYCNFSHNTISNSNCYVTTKKKRWNNRLMSLLHNDNYRFGDDLYPIEEDKDKRKKTEHTYKTWAKALDTYHDKLGYNVTNFFYIPGHVGKVTWTKDTSDYTVCACIGIDSRKAKRKDVLSFLNNFKALLQKISFEIIVGIKNNSLKKQNELLKEKNILSEHSALRTCIALVMTRNLAHNYGAHMLINLSKNGAYENLCDEEIKQTLYRFISNEKVFENGKNYQLPFLFQHLKDRMEYMCEITLDVPSLLTSRNLYSDVMKRFDRVRILLNYISGISGFKYKFIVKNNGRPICNENDVDVALPSDILGCQAFYNILENIIRNTAKHAKYDEQEEVSFTIEIKEIPEANEFYCVEIDNGVKEENIHSLVSKQNKLINSRIFDKDYNLRRHSLGLIEMAASAAFLRQLDVTKIDSEEYHYNDTNEYDNNQHNLIILKAINKNGALGYRFFLQKPKEFLFVGDWEVNDQRERELLDCGIHFIKSDDFETAMNNGTSFTHPFLIYQKSTLSTVKELLMNNNECCTLLPVRKLEMGKEDVEILTNKINTMGRGEIVQWMKDFLWAKYYKNVIVQELKNPDNEESIVVTELDDYKSPFKNQVVFLNHKSKELHEQYWKQIQQDDSFEAWVEHLTSRTSIKLPEFSRYSDGDLDAVSDYVRNIEEVEPINYEIFEAYHNKVLVLDERIQKFSIESFEGSAKGGGQIPSSALFESTNVLIPEPPLDPNAFDEESIYKIEQFVNDNMANAFLLIHYGLLERMYQETSLITEKLTTWAKGSKRVVITSGRGAHSLSLPKTVCFVNLSSVLNAFMENRNKFIINNLLNQSRRKNE